MTLIEETDDKDDKWDKWDDGRGDDRHGKSHPSLVDNARRLALLNLSIRGRRHRLLGRKVGVTSTGGR